VFVPAKVKEVYLYHLLEAMGDHRVRSAIVFVGTCRGAQLLALLLRELGLPCAELHSGARGSAPWGSPARMRCWGLRVLSPHPALCAGF
jgi:ATP-dependent RNA helicase DDX49/DBP8